MTRHVCQCIAAYAVVVFASVTLAQAQDTWKTFEDKSKRFSIRYPSSWQVWSDEQIAAAARGQAGPKPAFAVQSPSRDSLYVVLESVMPLGEKVFDDDRKKHLRAAYLGMCGRDPAIMGWKQLSETVVTLADHPAVEYVWQMPETQGIVLINKHWCTVAGTQGVFIGATAAKGDFDKTNKEYFALMAASLQLGAATAASQRPPTAQPTSQPAGRIAFRSDRDGNWEIYVMDLDGTPLRRLTNNPAKDEMPRWSPDGKQIVFRSERDGSQELYTMTADGAAATRLTKNDTKDSEPSFSPDGSRILFSSKESGDWELYTVKVDGSDQTRVSRDQLKAGGARFSPDGSRIVFSSMRDGDPEVYAVDANGANLKRLTKSPGYDGGSIFSPSGKRIAFMSARDGNLEIYLMNPDGTDPVNVTRSKSNEGGPAFIDDDTLVFFTDRDGDVEIYKMDLRTKATTRLTNSPGYDGMPDVFSPTRE